MKRLLLPLLLFANSGFAAQGRTLTLDECIAIALKESSSVLKAEADSETRATQLLQGYLQWLPNLSLSANYNEFRGKTFLSTTVPTLVKGSNNGAAYAVTSTLNIFNGLSDYSSFRSVYEKKAAADKLYERAKEQITLDVSQSFLQVVLDSKLVQIASSNFKTSQDRENLLQAQSKVGTRSLSDLFRQQAQTSQDQSYLITTRNKLETDKIALMKKLRIDPRENVEFVEPQLAQQPHEEAVDVEALTQQALQSRRDYGAAQNLAEAADRDVRTAQSGYYPRLDFVASYATAAREFDYQKLNGVDQVLPEQAPLWDQLQDHGGLTYGLALTWNLFDRLLTRSNVAQARGTALKARLDAEDYRNQVIGEVRQVVNDRSSATQQLQTSQVGLTAAQKSFEVSEGRYGVGSLSFVDLSAAQTALLQAQAAFAQAVINYELQKRAFRFVLGSN